ncbi:VWFA domain-containing protein [Caenorhabditis elegans]|nr:VWFA domain-containing protein [Caenorhabditis elegans]CCD71843.1 VWFA domain-containing protein [Caenorhabditis elegans]|eukprot:NP_872008.2 Uncharacterized protein CELE_T19D12.4 [Caenorhabditis elegans]
MVAAQQNNGKIFGRFDPIHIGLAVISIIFLILSIVFIILFATKHDSSSGFLATGFSDSNASDVSNDLRGLLKNKYTVNSFAADVQDKTVSAVFSLRDSVSADDVQKVLAGSKLVSQVETTYGDKATAVCRRQQTFASTVSAAPTNPPTTVTTAAPPVVARYCKSNPITRDIVLVVDMDDLEKNNHTEKMASLTVIRDSLVKGITFPQANIFVKAVINNTVTDISKKFADNADQFKNDFNILLNTATFYNALSFKFADVLAQSIANFKTGRQYVPGAIFAITDKRISSAVESNPKDIGIYVGVTGVRDSYLKSYADARAADEVISKESWTELANSDPFATLICSFFKLPTTQMSSQLEYLRTERDAVIDTPKCEVLDMIIAFDTSESLSSLIVPQYVDFAKKLVAQYKYGNDNTRVGIITFSSDVVEVRKLTDGNTLDAVNAAIDTVHYTGGLTNVTKAQLTAKNLFDTESNANRNKVLFILTDGVPTVDTYTDEVAAGDKLKSISVISFFVGYSSYSDEVKTELGKVSEPKYIFGNMTFLPEITAQILTTYPCPVPKCVTAYYAIEISEATDDYVVQNLQDILNIATQASTMQTGTESYQIVTYNDAQNTQFNPKGDASFASFKAFVQGLIADPKRIAAMRRGITRLDLAIDDVTAEMKAQATKNIRFSSDILFFGQANDAVLKPDVDTNAKFQLLKTAADALKAQTGGLIYVVDDSRPANNFGKDLWTAVTLNNNIIQYSQNNAAVLKTNTDYYDTWKKLSCNLPALGTCYDTPLDVAVLVDLQNKDYDFMNYITKLLNQFSTQDDTHFSMFAYGAFKTSVISGLSVHSSQDISNFAVTYEDWRNGTYFITTTTPAPTTTNKPANFWNNNLYTVDQTMMSGVFDTLGTQFGCGHYSDDTDRIFAPNLFIFASDNFGTYDASVWTDFQAQLRNRYGCWDCAGTPTFLFISRNAAGPPDTLALGQTIHLTTADLDIDASDDTSTQSSINQFNNLLNTICVTALPTCTTYTSTCKVA